MLKSVSFISVLFFYLICLNRMSFVKSQDVNEEFRRIQGETLELVEIWANEIGRRLTELSVAMTREEEVRKSFQSLKNHLYKIDGLTLTETLAMKIRSFMLDKTEAVQNIAQFAEYLSYHRNTNKSYLEETQNEYYYYDTDQIKNTDNNATITEDLKVDVFLMECVWFCKYVENYLEPPSQNRFNNETLRELFEKRHKEEGTYNNCNCNSPPDVTRSESTYSSLPMNDDNRFSDKVNFNVSVVKVATNIYERDMTVLEGIRWSEALDLVFKQNFLKDPDLIWQYFASPSGFMRHYPAIKWSEERYHQTYDFRTRSWYTEAMTSPKDIVILVDRSGSMKGKKRALSLHIVNDILDTLNDNDFVNIFTFANTTLPLVDCFNDTLFQANEENLRLLRENLPVYELKFVANISVALEKAFDILQHFRVTKKGSECNQAIMLITEGIDYPYDVSLFNNSNWNLGYPVRIFTYLVSTEKDDEKQMEFIACSNLGYYVNMTLETDIREKILKYVTVMSRPINLQLNTASNEPERHVPGRRQVEIWSYLYVDLADRRLSNWLWTKFEGIRQREVFLDHSKRRVERLQLKYTSQIHMLLQEDHEYRKYEEKENYKYMTTVSLPVYGRRDNEYDLIGVAGVDVPIEHFRTRIPHELIGVNGYAFIITNNGYILMHPEHRTEFEYILKPTFNRVDFLETEILDDDNKPRNFGDAIVKLRERMIRRGNGTNEARLKIKYTLDDMKRIIKGTRFYYFSPIGPFTLCIVLPDKYGLVKVNKSHDLRNVKEPPRQFILNNKFWRVHPEWIYCKNCSHEIQHPMKKIEYAYYHPASRSPLYYHLMYDVDKTQWFDKSIANEQRYTELYDVYKVFMSTSSGLTRWKNYRDVEAENSRRSIDEDWYQRSVEENYDNEEMFIFSVPFEISGYENNTIRGTKAIFVGKNKMKTPIAVVGLEFNHQKMYAWYNNITTTKFKTSKQYGSNITCESNYLDCFILDNNAYILLSDEIEYTGRFIGDIRPDVMYFLVKEEVYEPTRMFDYQATCQLEPPEPTTPDKQQYTKPAEKNSSSKSMPIFHLILRNIYDIIKWFLVISMQLLKIVDATPDQVLKDETKIFVTLKINKTFPTPCDREMWLFTLKTGFRPTFYNPDATKFSCNWRYVVRRIPRTNLLFLAINNLCPMETKNTYPHMPDPMKISYNYRDSNVSLPCYIAIMNNYTRRRYISCFKKDKRENALNKLNRAYCGHTWT